MECIANEFRAHPVSCCLPNHLPCRGDYVEILIIPKDGIRREEITLKLD